MNLKKKIEYNVCPWCEDHVEFRPICRKTLGHAQYQAHIALKNLFNEIVNLLKKPFRF